MAQGNTRRAKPAYPVAMSTAVGPRRACVSDVETGTTMTDAHVRHLVEAIVETTITGRRPDCSAPERGASSAQ